MARIRTFIAVPLDDALRARCVGMQEKLARAGTGVKWADPEGMHVTLLFLGEVGDREIPALCRAVADACAPHASFPMTLAGLGCFPNTRRPRVVWAGITEGREELIALHDALEGPLLELGCYRREERQYTPHATFGRVNGIDDTSALAAAVLKHGAWTGGSTEVREVHVMASDLTREGPVYSVLSRAKLG